MNKDLNQELIDRFPKIFTDKNFFLEIDDGWYNIINKLCGNIQSHIDWREKNREQDTLFNAALRKALDGDQTDLINYYCRGNPDKEPTQWNLDRIKEDMENEAFRKVEPEIPQVVAVQVKEKFGGLRFYYNGGDDHIRGVISMAESMSYVICEKCGRNGERRPTRWIKTLCDEHFKEFSQNKKD